MSISVNSSSIVFPLRFTGRFSRANLDDLNSPYSSFLINIVPRLLLFPPFLNKIRSEYLPSASSSLENISWHLTNKHLPPPQEHRNTFMAPSRLTRSRKKKSRSFSPMSSCAGMSGGALFSTFFASSLGQGALFFPFVNTTLSTFRCLACWVACGSGSAWNSWLLLMNSNFSLATEGVSPSSPTANPVSGFTMSKCT